MLPGSFARKLFAILQSSNFIDPCIHAPYFWETSCVCLSSNDSAMDVQFVEPARPAKLWHVIDADNCWHFENAPKFWGLGDHTSWVQVSEHIWGEIGPIHKAPADQHGPLCHDVERTLLLKTANGWSLTFASLFQTDICMARFNGECWEVRS
jgi:hypothetical protein